MMTWTGWIHLTTGWPNWTAIGRFLGRLDGKVSPVVKKNILITHFQGKGRGEKVRRNQVGSGTVTRVVKNFEKEVIGRGP